MEGVNDTASVAMDREEAQPRTALSTMSLADARDIVDGGWKVCSRLYYERQPHLGRDQCHLKTWCFSVKLESVVLKGMVLKASSKHSKKKPWVW